MSPGSTTPAEVADAVVLLGDVCARLEPDSVDVVDVESVFDALVVMERLAGGAVMRMAARYAQVGVWRRSGARSVEEHLGSKTGVSATQARRQLAASKRLGSQRGTDEALRLGVVSGVQAVEVSDAVDVSPSSERELLRSARVEPLHQLRKRAAAAKAAADCDREATRRRLHRLRSMRRWNDADGMGNLLLKLPADEMVEIDASLKAPIDHIFADARRDGRVEPAEAYAADAMVARLLGRDPAAARGSATVRQATGDGRAADSSCGDDAFADSADASGASAGDGLSPPTRRSQAVRPDKKVIAVIDVEALNRGRVEGDEQCEIAGVGPVSVSSVRRLLSDAFLAIVIKDGVDVRNVVHLGRQVTAHQRTALETRGGACEFCGSTFRVEIDHIKGWALTHTTHIDDLSLKCWHCHEQKTRLELHETGPPGNRTFLNPDHTPRPTPRTGANPPNPLGTTTDMNTTAPADSAVTGNAFDRRQAGAIGRTRPSGQSSSVVNR